MEIANSIRLESSINTLNNHHKEVLCAIDSEELLNNAIAILCDFCVDCIFKHY